MPLDLRIQKLAKILVDHSVEVKKGDNVIISGGVEANELVLAVYKEVILRGAHPVLRLSIPGAAPFFYKYANKEQIEKYPEFVDYMMRKSQKYIGILSEMNTKELSKVDPKKISARARVTLPISEYICNSRPKMMRVTTAFPTNAFAQDAEMSLTEYEDFFYGACLQDWDKLGKDIDKINSVFEKGKEVHLIGENVDLKFSIKGKNCKPDKGEENMPGGEVFMAPVRESMNGWIKFEYPAIRGGREVTGVELKFEKGKVVEATASKNEDFLKEMLKTDENASYVGEFGIGCNPKVTGFTGELLFDEKIGGTIHLALGSAYKDNGGGNDSALHWDIVKDMKKAKIVLDGKVIQENGKWKIKGLGIVK